jgi:hypothetical protein
MNYVYWKVAFRNWFGFEGGMVFDIALTGLSLGLILILYLYIRRSSISFSLLQRCVFAFYLLLIPYVLLACSESYVYRSCYDVGKSNAFIYSEELVVTLAMAARWTLLPAIVYMCGVIVQLYRQCKTESPSGTDLKKS